MSSDYIVIVSHLSLSLALHISDAWCKIWRPISGGPSWQGSSDAGSDLKQRVRHSQTLLMVFIHVFCHLPRMLFGPTRQSKQILWPSQSFTSILNMIWMCIWCRLMCIICDLKIWWIKYVNLIFWCNVKNMTAFFFSVEVASAIWPFTWFSPSEVSTVDPTPGTHSLAKSSRKFRMVRDVSTTKWTSRKSQSFSSLGLFTSFHLYSDPKTCFFPLNPSESLWYLRAQRCRRSCQFENRMSHAWLFVVRGKTLGNECKWCKLMRIADRTGATDMIQLQFLRVPR